MHINNLVQHVRFYPEGNTYKDKDSYDTIMTVVWLDDTTVSFQGLRGIFNAKRRLKLWEYYTELGVTKAYYERDGVKITLRA